jgi:putative oxidoreductase
MNALIERDTMPHSRASARGLRWLLATPDDGLLLVSRLTLGGVVLMHGAQKALGWFGGGGVGGTIDFFQSALGLPAIVALLVTFSDFIGSLALIAGFMTRVAAVGTSLVMLGAVVTIHVHNGFFMNWFGNQSGEGFEFHLLALALATALIARGGGRAALHPPIHRPPFFPAYI